MEIKNIKEKTKRLPGGSLFVYVRQVREHLYFLEERDAELRTGSQYPG